MRPAPKSKNRAHTGSMEIRAIWSSIDLTWRPKSVTWSAPHAFVDAAMYSSGTPSTMSTLASHAQERLGLGRGCADIERHRDVRTRRQHLLRVHDLPFLGASAEQLAGPSAGGLSDEVVALGDVRGPAGGLRVRRAGGRQVAVELVQVAADGMPPVAVAEHLA
jgi:hypothetical protein